MTVSSVQHFDSANVLVTGGAGFIGSHLVERLVSLGAKVTVVDNLQAGTWSNLDGVRKVVTMVEGDVRDAALMQSVVRDAAPAYVIHLAANASVPGSVEDPIYDYETNCSGTVTVLEALRQTGSQAKVVVASSAAVYGEPQSFPITEESKLAPISPYGASKTAAEFESITWSKVYGTHVVAARIFNTYGPRMPRFVVLDFLRKLQSDPTRLEILGNGTQIRDFNYVTDTAEGLLTLALEGVSGEAYNLASGVSHSITQLAEMLLRIVGLEGKTSLEYTGSSWVGDAQRWEVDVAKIQALGHRTRVDLEAGLELVVDWFGFDRS